MGEGRWLPGRHGKCAKTAEAKIVDNGAVCTFEGIEKGRYAISILHDANNNGKIDLNVLGIPKEGFGASNDTPPGPTSPPTSRTLRSSLTGPSSQPRLDHAVHTRLTLAALR